MKILGKIQNKIRGWHLSTWLIISLIPLNYLDFRTTLWLMDHKEMGEFNPFLDHFISLLDTPWVIFWYKLIALAVLFIPYILFLRWRHCCQKNWMVWTLGFVNVYYISIVIFNTYLILL